RPPRRQPSSPDRARNARGSAEIRLPGSWPSSRIPTSRSVVRVAGKLRGRMPVERTLILAKPDAVERNLASEIVARFERVGLKLRAARCRVASRAHGAEHNIEQSHKPFYGELAELTPSGPTLAFGLEGEGAIATARKTIGATNPAEADPGSLRGEFGLAMPNNLVHGSDSPESAEREIGLWFPDGLV